MIRVLLIIILYLNGTTSLAQEASDNKQSPDIKNESSNLSRDPALQNSSLSREHIQNPVLNPDTEEGTLTEAEAIASYDEPFRIAEYRPNYFIWGKPDAKIQFSFKFNILKDYNLYLGYTQVMFWDLGEDSNPFSDINFNPELFYRFVYKYPIFFTETDLGYSHTSNGEDGKDSRSVEELFLQLTKETAHSFGISRLQIRLRYFYSEDNENKELKDFYGPVVVKLAFTKLGRRIFFTEQFFVEYYNGGQYAQDFSKSSVRVSFRFKLFRSITAPKVFVQYFNGYGENLKNFNIRDESFRIGLSIGGQ